MHSVFEHMRKLFYDRIKKTPSCWLWTGLLSPQGYGRLKISKKQKVASRVSWEIHKGEIPKGMFICHTCDNPSCVNPDHLFLGTPKDNTHDMINKNRKHSNVGKRNPMALLDEEKVERIRKMLKSGMKQYEVGKLFGLKQSSISNIKTGKNWPHVAV